MHGPSDQGADSAIGEINVIPFIDICLVLLIIVLMNAAKTVELKELELPIAGTSEYRDMNLAINLSIDKQGKYYFEEGVKPIEARSLWAYLEDIQGDSPWSIVVIRADQKTPYKDLVLAIQCVQSLGCEDISFAVKDPKQAAAAKGKATASASAGHQSTTR